MRNVVGLASLVLRLEHSSSQLDDLVHTGVKGDDDRQGIFHQEEKHFIRTIGDVGQKVGAYDEKRQILGESDVDHRPHGSAEETLVDQRTSLVVDSTASSSSADGDFGSV